MKRLKIFERISKIRKSVILRTFTLTMLLVLTSVILMTWLWSANMHQTVRELSEKYFTDIVGNANLKFENEFHYINSILENVASKDLSGSFALTNEDSARTALQSYLSETFTLLNDYITGIAVITPENTVAAGAYFPTNSASSKWYSDIIAAKGEKIVLSRMRSDSKTMSDKISLGKAITDGGRYIGVVILDIRDSVIVRNFGMSHMNGLMRTILIAPDGNVMYCDSTLGNDEITYLRAAISENGIYNHFLTTKINSKEYFVVAKKFASSPDWLNITICPTEPLYQSSNRVIRMLYIMIICIALITLLPVSAAFFSTKKSFHELSRYIEMIDLNNITEVKEVVAPVKDSDIIMIFNKVNQMVDTISGQLKTISAQEDKKRINEIQILKTQINPHLIYNTLNLIQTSAEFQKNTAISNLAKSLSELLRYSVADVNKLVPLQSEIDYIKNYIEIIQNKFVNNINVTVMTEPAILKYKVLKMILQPIVENSIKHGFTDLPGQSIIIKAYEENSCLLIKISDNGIGIEPGLLSSLLHDDGTDGSHLGLNNVNRRIKLTFGNDCGISLFSVSGIQTTVFIKLPLISDDNEEVFDV